MRGKVVGETVRARLERGWSKALAVTVVVWLGAGAVGCGHSSLENYQGLKFDRESEIPDSPENRKVLDLVVFYKQAMEKRDSKALEGIVSSGYYENGGTTDTTRDDG